MGKSVLRPACSLVQNKTLARTLPCFLAISSVLAIFVFSLLLLILMPFTMNVPARAFRRQTLTASRRLQRASVRTPLRGATATIRTVHSGIPSVKVNNDRMSASLHHTCQWGAAHRYGKCVSLIGYSHSCSLSRTCLSFPAFELDSDPTATGMRRLTLDDNDARARKWFVDETSALGCEHVIDQVGSLSSIIPKSLQLRKMLCC